ncbi:MAG: glycosyltransferase family 4 protein [bacterium]|nr:glycosyltransferase family 4 protein [bacterium]
MQNSNKKDNILILTQRVDVNDDVLGFMHGWIREFAKYCEMVTVICLQKGEYELSDNVKVLSLGKPAQGWSASGREKLWRRIKALVNFFKYIWLERRNYDSVFVHMNKEYVLLGGLFWKLAGKKIGLWYTHKAVNLKLIIAEKLADVIFTASKESFRLPSKKVMVTGHGIDINKFSIFNFQFSNKDSKKFKIITVGRISPIKDYETLIKAIEILAKDGVELRVDIIGGPGTPEQEKYLADLKEMAREKKLDGIINFIGAVSHKDIVQYYNNADLSVNLCPTGGMDKAVLESMACGVPVVVFNKTFVDVLGDYKDDLILANKSETELAEKIKKIINLPKEKKENMQKDLRDVVVKNHSLDNLISKIVSELNK